MMEASTLEQQQSMAPPPLPHRRPRVREVSSRFMSPMVPSTSTTTPSEFQRSKSVQRRRTQEQDSPQPLLSRADTNIPETSQSLDTPLGSRSHTHHHSKAGPSVSSSLQTIKKQRGKILKENGEPRPEHQNNFRPDTPLVGGAADRIVPSRYRQSFQRPNLTNTNGAEGAATHAAKLLQDVTSAPTSPRRRAPDEANGNHSNTCNSATITRSNSCPNSPLCIQRDNKMRSHTDTRSSMTELVDRLSTTSIRWLKEKNSCTTGNSGVDIDSSKFGSSPCSRSLNFPPASSIENFPPASSLSVKASDRAASSVSRSYVKMASLCPPPHPTTMKMGTETKKGRKLSNYQDDVHSLKLLYNHYLQWRYANAKAEASMEAQKKDAERKLLSLGYKISDIREAVKGKRIELELLQRTKMLLTVLEAHMPYLEEWSVLEEDYSNSLLGAVNALINSSIRLPVSGNVRVDIKGLREALHTATEVMEMIGLHIQNFILKAKEADHLISELAKVIGGERSLVEECGDLLLKTFASQVKECSLRGHLLQLHRNNQCLPCNSDIIPPSK